MSVSKRVIIVGARFGEVYLDAFLKRRPRLELAGVVARGSPRAHQLAHGFGVPLYTDLDQLPGDIDIACVVLRAGVVGGAGSAVAQRLLERGIHVIQEHPLHPDEVQRLQRLALQRSLQYWVNTFYPHCSSPHGWIEAARRIRAQLGGAAPCFAQLTTSRQLLYSSLDVLMLAGGWDPGQGGAEAVAGRPDAAFRWLRLPMGAAEVALHLQADMDPADPDQHSQVMHHATLMWPSGYLTLVASHGPVTWTPTPHLHGHADTRQSLYRQPDATSGLRKATTCELHRPASNWRDALEVDGAEAVATVLQQLVDCLDGQPLAIEFRPDYQLALARLWQRVSQAAGAVRECTLSVPPEIDPGTLVSA